MILFRISLNKIEHSWNMIVQYLQAKGKLMITVSERAKSKIHELMVQDHIDLSVGFVRVGVQGGGCSGLTYQLGFDTELKENDKSFEDKGVTIVVDKKSFLYLVGTELDYSDGLNGKGFQFNNPNASRTCGCGESFSV